MTPIRKIVIPVDFSASSEHAARFGCALAQKLGAHVYLIHVVDDRNGTSHRLADVSGSPRRPYLEAKSAIQLVAERLGSDVQLTTEIRTGPVDEAIRSAVVAYGGDLVVMATHGRSGIPHLVFGSIAEEVIRTAPCPVLVMRDSGRVAVHQPSAQEYGAAAVA